MDKRRHRLTGFGQQLKIFQAPLFIYSLMKSKQRNQLYAFASAAGVAPVQATCLGRVQSHNTGLKGNKDAVVTIFFGKALQVLQNAAVCNSTAASDPVCIHHTLIRSPADHALLAGIVGLQLPRGSAHDVHRCQC